MEQAQVAVRDEQVSYLHDGDEGAPLVILVHGFPDTPHSWSALAGRLVAEGRRVVAPWLRGYAPSAVPADGNYQGGAYVADLLALADALDADDRTVLIGHDIGAAIAYGAAGLRPERFDRVVTLSVPPMPVLTAMMGTYDQLQRSWYTFVFQHPAAEAILAAGDFEFLRRLCADWSPGFDAGALLDNVRAALPAPENVAAVLGWYRAGFNPGTWDPALAAEQEALALEAPQPWLYLHGADDGCVGSEALDHIPGGVRIDEAGHFPHLEQPGTVGDLIAGFLAEADTGTPIGSTIGDSAGEGT